MNRDGEPERVAVWRDKKGAGDGKASCGRLNSSRAVHMAPDPLLSALTSSSTTASSSPSAWARLPLPLVYGSQYTRFYFPPSLFSPRR